MAKPAAGRARAGWLRFWRWFRCVKDAATKVEERALRSACRQTPGEFKAAVRRAVAKYDTKNQAERHRCAVEQRHVAREHVADGMGWLNLYAPSDGIEIIWTALITWSAKTDSADSRTADQQWGYPRQ